MKLSKARCLSLSIIGSLVFLTSVLPAQSITVTAPAAGAVWFKGTTNTITWTKTGAMADMVKIRLYDTTSTTVIHPIVDVTPNTGSYSWTVPNTLGAGNYRIRIRTVDNAVFNDSAVFTIANPPSAATITINSPSSGAMWFKGATNTITWTKTGAMADMVKIRLYDTTSTTVIHPIVDVTPNTGSYSWTVPITLEAGNYRIRIRTVDNAVFNDSAVFAIANPVLGIATPLVMPVDLAVTDIRYVFSRGGQLVARVRCGGVNSIDKDVEFRLQLPGTRENRLVTHRISLARNAEMDVYLRGLNQSDIPNPGLIVRVTADPNERLSDPDRSNNTLEKRLGILDLSCQTPFGDLEVSRMYLQGGEDYRVKFKIRVRHNLTQPVNRIHVRYAMMDVVGPTETLVIESLAPGEEWVHQVNLTFGKEGRPRSKRPRLRSGTTYRFQVMLLDPTNSFFDVNPRNNTDTLAFRIPD